MTTSILLALAFGLVTTLAHLDPPDADIKYDWLVARESLAADGDVYRDILLQAHDEGIDIAVHAGRGIEELTGHPRTPGAILLQIPLVMLSPDRLFTLSVMVSLVATGLLAILQVDRARNFAILVLAAALLTAPLWITLRFAGQAAVVASLAIGGWRLVQRNADSAGGFLIGLGAVLKVFPAFLLVPLILARRWKAAMTLILTVLGTNLVGLMLPGVSLTRALDVLPMATSTWVDLLSNGSLVGPFMDFGFSAIEAQIIVLVSMCALISGLMFKMGPRRIIEAMVASPFPAIAIGLLVIPLSWISYDMVLLPVVVAMAASKVKAIHLAGIMALGLWAVPVVLWPLTLVPSGELSIVVRSVVFVVCLVAFRPLVDWSLRGTGPISLQGGGQGADQTWKT